MTRSDVLDRGRSAFDEHRWTAAFEAFTEAEADDALDAADLERLSTVALLLGREDEGIDVATRAHEAFLGIGRIPHSGCRAERLRPPIGATCDGSVSGARTSPRGRPSGGSA